MMEEGREYIGRAWMPGNECRVNKLQRQEAHSWNIKGWKMGMRAQVWEISKDRACCCIT